MASSDSSKIDAVKGQVDDLSTDRVAAVMADMADRANATISDGTRRANETRDDVTERARQQPLLAIGSAFAAGYFRAC